jgi:translation initiation factor 4G
VAHFLVIARRYQPSLLKDATDPEVVLKKANLVLNKLSIDKFDKLSTEFMNVGIENPELMARGVDLIVSKAQMEEHFAFMYANLCRKIIKEWSSKSEAEGAAVNAGLTFREHLLVRCEDEFDVDWIDKLASVRNVRDWQKILVNVRKVC